MRHVHSVSPVFLPSVCHEYFRSKERGIGSGASTRCSLVSGFDSVDEPKKESTNSFLLMLSLLTQPLVLQHLASQLLLSSTFTHLSALHRLLYPALLFLVIARPGVEPGQWYYCIPMCFRFGLFGLTSYWFRSGPFSSPCVLIVSNCRVLPIISMILTMTNRFRI